MSYYDHETTAFEMGAICNMNKEEEKFLQNSSRNLERKRLHGWPQTYDGEHHGNGM
jgi:hypothetical protein